MKGCFVTQYMIYLGEYSMCTREESIFCSFGMQSSKCICQVHLVQCIVQGPCFLLILCLDLSIVVSGVLKSPTIGAPGWLSRLSGRLWLRS